ncbi:hypothetical protein GSI_05025 [Ganoderma sinense ZZ0214-1]|uniref:Uncharacterized protein n=1 Tax=Ganoderma sinense ZZ0214-1 TaxID=1077348 RepID=A0A2G8SGS8_9APHY|nr:hypothetical protein GSI_05019 [Ganoderma sinense ZZ0214-1]PIL32907.1 hypothetical protein GSI_05025 [Ganoderma sinense ZZ0214-1]
MRKFDEFADRMVDKFYEWCSSWIAMDGSGMSGNSVEDWKRRATYNIRFVSDVKAEWLELFLRVFGDFPELWGITPSSTYSPIGPSASNRNSINSFISDAGSFPAAQAVPSSMLGIPTSLNVDRPEGNSAGPSATYPDEASSFQLFLAQSGPELISAMSSHPTPPLSLYDSTGMYHGDTYASQSLPNLPYGATSEDIVMDGLEGDYSGYDPMSWGHHGHASGPSSTQYNPQRFVPEATVQTAPSDTGLSAMTPHAALGTSHSVTGTPSLRNPVASDGLPFAFMPGVTPVVTAGHGVRHGLGSTSRRSFDPAPAQSPQSPGIGEAIGREIERANTLANRTLRLRERSNHLDEYLELLLSSSRLFYDGMFRVVGSDTLAIPLPLDHREAMLDLAENLDRVMDLIDADLERDMET